MDHVDGPSGLCEELCQHGLLVHATGAGGATAANDGGAVQRYAMRRCEGQWDLQLVPAEAAEAKQDDDEAEKKGKEGKKGGGFFGRKKK